MSGAPESRPAEGPPSLLRAAWVAQVRGRLEQAGRRDGEWIGAEEARACAPVRDAVDVVRDGLLWEAYGRIVIPESRRAVSRLIVPAAGLRISTVSKCCAVPDLGLVGYRFLGSILGDDPVRCLHLVDSTRRALIATIDEHLTYLVRIAALAVVVVEHTVAAPAPAVGMVGAGRLARAILEALIAVGRVREIMVTSRRPASRERLVRGLRAAGFAQAHAVDSAREVAQRADFLVTATNAASPVIASDWIKPGATVYGLGDAVELPEDLLVRRRRGPVRLIVSNWLECAQRADFSRLVADGRVDASDVDAELWEVIEGTKPARPRSDTVVCVRAPGSVGLDTLLGAWVWARRAAAAHG